jgi:hypothetical protein
MSKERGYVPLEVLRTEQDIGGPFTLSAESTIQVMFRRIFQDAVPFISRDDTGK